MKRFWSITSSVGAILSAALVFSQQWNPVGPGGQAYGLVVQNDTLYASYQNNGVYRSIDHGQNWVAVNSGITSTSHWWLASVNGCLFAGTQFGDSFRSCDGGENWTNIGLSGARAFVEHNDTLFAGEWYGCDVFWSVDNGDGWTNGASLGGSGLWPLLSRSPYLILGKQGAGVYRSAGAGANWVVSNVGLPSGASAYAFTVIGNDVLVGTDDGVYRSSDDGVSWQSSSAGLSGIVYALHASNGIVYAGTGSSGVFMSSDNGASWLPMNTGLTAGTVVALASDSEHLFCGTLGGSVYRYGDLDSGVEGGDGLWVGLGVHPNPLNGEATIRFFLNQTANARIELHDALGRNVAFIHNGFLPQGEQQLTWDAGELPHGAYTISLRVDDRTAAIRAVIMR
jgi:hypothetical protein